MANRVPKFSIYVQDEPQRRIALVPESSSPSENGGLASPLIIGLSAPESTQQTPTLEVELFQLPEFQSEGWQLLNTGYGYIGTLSLGTANEVFAGFILGYRPVAKLIEPDGGALDPNYPVVEDEVEYDNVFMVTRVGFLSLVNSYHDSEFLGWDLNQRPQVYSDEEDNDSSNRGYMGQYSDGSSDSEMEYIHLQPNANQRPSASYMPAKNKYQPTRPPTMPKPNSNNTSHNVGGVDDASAGVDLPYSSVRKLLSTQNFLFSPTVDLTRSLQEKYCAAQDIKRVQYLGDMDFLWNANLLSCQLAYHSKLARQNPKLGFSLFACGLIMPLVQGFVTTFFNGIGKGKERATIISRVCWKRAGTRFHARGLDDDGFPANLVETEVQLVNERSQIGFRALRGSVPGFWTQEGNQLLGHKIQMTRSLDATQPACDRHFNWIQSKYGNPLRIINLLGRKENSAEAMLSQRFEQLVANTKSKAEINFTSFDFHVLCKGNQYEPAHRLINQLSTELEKSGYFMWDIKEMRIIKRQTGVIRVNCLDCLDRTNVILGLVLNYIFERMLLLSHLRGPLAEASSNNGDTISRIYAGTGALQSGVSTGGKASLVNRLQDASKSVSRLYLHHFHDKAKQDAIDLLLGRSPNAIKLRLAGQSDTDSHMPTNPSTRSVAKSDTPPTVPPRPNFKGQSASSFDTVDDFPPLIIHCGSYNVNGRVPSGRSLGPWLQPLNSGPLPDIYALAFEEIVELTPSQILAADLDRTAKWESLLLRDLGILAGERGGPNHAGYTLLTSEQLVGICLFVFVKRDKLSSISQVARGIKKTGLRGMAGNKGAAAIRFRYLDKSMVFLACHFASGQTKFEERNKDFHTIHSGGGFFPMYGGLNSHDTIIYIGDFNYRINLPNDQVRVSIKTGQLGYLIQHDQLLEAKRRGCAFIGFEEGDLQFPPTYKYDVGTDTYDTSEKRRIPAWTDRILYRGDKRWLSQTYYNCAPLYESDHRPIIAGFVMNFNQSKSLSSSAASSATGPPLAPRPGSSAAIPKRTTPNKSPPLLVEFGDSPDEDDEEDDVTLPEPSSHTNRWWQYPLTNPQSDHSNSATTKRPQQSSELDIISTEPLLIDLDAAWNSRSNPINNRHSTNTNPFKQPGLKAALAKMRRASLSINSNGSSGNNGKGAKSGKDNGRDYLGGYQPLRELSTGLSPNLMD